MFEVRTKSPMDERREERDAEIEEAAGRPSDFSGAGAGYNECAGRDHGWRVETFAEARELKARLDRVEGVAATIREENSGAPASV